VKTFLKINREDAKAQSFLKELSLHSWAVGGMNAFMNPSACLDRSNRTSLRSRNQSHAFTLTELAVVIATIAVLAMVVLPALAGAANKGGRMQCAANLRQNYVASMIYANEYRGWLPPCTIGGANAGGKFNNLQYLDYTLYVYEGTANAPVPTNGPYSSFSNLGYLYRNGLAGNGLIFFCPDQWGTRYGANTYLPLLSANLVFSGGQGVVQSSYAFNPRIVDPTNGIIARRYQKTSDLEPHKLFAVDFFGGAGGASFSYVNMPHFRERGWNVLFTDGSVQFSQNVQANNLIQNFSDQETVAANEAADLIFNCLELDH
jgi:type II secretory pathway pseudopilin PulG